MKFLTYRLPGDLVGYSPLYSKVPAWGRTQFYFQVYNRFQTITVTSDDVRTDCDNESVISKNVEYLSQFKSAYFELVKRIEANNPLP